MSKMTLDEYERLTSEATNGPLYDYDGITYQGDRFLAASREMAPKLIAIVKQYKRCLECLNNGDVMGAGNAQQDLDTMLAALEGAT